jgi:DNA-binding MarR family transcriptional regulator
MKDKARKPKRDGIVSTETAQGMAAHLLRRSVQICVALFLDQMQAYAITPVQYAALVTIHDHPGLDQGRLGAITSIDRSTIGGAVQRLEARGLVQRRLSPEDQRVKQAFITTAGRELLRKTREDLDLVQERLLAPLTSNEQDTLLALLAKVVGAHRTFTQPVEQSRDSETL